MAVLLKVNFHTSNILHEVNAIKVYFMYVDGVFFLKKHFLKITFEKKQEV